jgi:hypothetical protein
MRWACWNKPLNVTQPIRISQSLEPIPEPIWSKKRDVAHKPLPSTYLRRYYYRYVTDMSKQLKQ